MYYSEENICKQIEYPYVLTVVSAVPSNYPIFKTHLNATNVILLPKFFLPTVRKNCSSDREKLLKFEAEGQEFSNFLRLLEQFIQTVKGQNKFW